MLFKLKIKNKIKKILKDANINYKLIEVEKNRIWIHIIVVSEDFIGKTSSERENIMWREFEKEFDDEAILSISQCYFLTQEEHFLLIKKWEKLDSKRL